MLETIPNQAPKSQLSRDMVTVERVDGSGRTVIWQITNDPFKVYSSPPREWAVFESKQFVAIQEALLKKR